MAKPTNRHIARVPSHVRRLALAAAVVIAIAPPTLRASTVYSNLTPLDPLVGDQSFFGLNGAILDDVPVPAAMNPAGAAVPVMAVTFGIIRDPGAPACTITAYAGTPTTVLPYPVLNSALATLGSATLGAYGSGVETVQMVTITPAAPAMVAPNLLDQPGFGELAIGLWFSERGGKNSWAVALPAAPDVNWDGAWDYRLNTGSGAAYTVPDYTTFVMSVRTSLPSAWRNDAGGAWSSSVAWWGGSPGAGGATGDGARFGSAITTPRTVTLDAPRSVGTLIFDNVNRYTIAGTSTLTIDTPGGAGSIGVLSGGHTIAAPLNLAVPTTVQLAGSSTLSVTGSLSAVAGATLTVSGTGTMEVKNLRLDAVQITAPATVKVLSDGTTTGMSKVGALSLSPWPASPGARLDLTDNAMVVDYGGASPRAAIESYVAAGYHGGTWDGAGIVSSTAASSNARRMAVGVAEAAEVFSAFPATFRGQSVDATSVLLRYTVAGDANLDGAVDLTDFTFLASSFNGTGKHWINGDFDYSGTVDLTDFTLLAANFNYVLPADASSIGATVPEPAALSIMLLIAAQSGIRRRRGHVTRSR